MAQAPEHRARISHPTMLTSDGYFSLFLCSSSSSHVAAEARALAPVASREKMTTQKNKCKIKEKTSQKLSTPETDVSRGCQDPLNRSKHRFHDKAILFSNFSWMQP